VLRDPIPKKEFVEAGVGQRVDMADERIVYDQGLASDGNIASKSDLGGYTYGGTGFNPAPHAVTAINISQGAGCTLSSCTFDGLANPSIYYDADGNMTVSGPLFPHCLACAGPCRLLADSARKFCTYVRHHMRHEARAGAG
jgi:hypothetical protein